MTLRDLVKLIRSAPREPDARLVIPAGEIGSLLRSCRTALESRAMNVAMTRRLADAQLTIEFLRKRVAEEERFNRGFQKTKSAVSNCANGDGIPPNSCPAIAGPVAVE